MVAGERYDALDAELVAERLACERALRAFNGEADPGAREQIMRGLLAALGERSYIRPPFFCDYGWNVSIGEGVFINFNCVILDVVPVTIGDRVQIASAVQFLAADHPIDAAERAGGLEHGRPITVGDDAWLGGGAILCPGVSVGRGSVVGAGSVVTRDVPAGVVAAGNPCRVLHALT
jgi:maltose O-acetyltransferase